MPSGSRLWPSTAPSGWPLSAGRATGTGRLIAWAGAVALALTAYRTSFPPGPDGLLHPAWRAYLALAGATATVAGGVVAARGESVGETGMASASWPGPPQNVLDQAAALSTGGSVAPPGRQARSTARRDADSPACRGPGLRGCDSAPHCS